MAHSTLSRIPPAAMLLFGSILLPQQPEPPSARLDALREALAEAEGPSAVDALWAELSATGIPLVEAAQRADLRRVTFLYRPGQGEPVPDEVQLESGLLSALRAPPCMSESELGRLHPLEESGLWYLTLDLPAGLRAPYRFRLREPGAAQASVRLDSANPQVFAPGTRWARSSLVLAGAPAQPWREKRARGRWTSLSVESAVFGPRELPVYLPPGYDLRRKEPWPVVLGLDSFAFQEPLLPADRMLDYLADGGAMPASVLVLTHDVGPYGDEHGYAPVVSYLVDEVLPVSRTELGIAHDPAAVTLAGTSRRGMISALTAFERPDSVGKVISLSGSFYWRPPGDPEYEWLVG